MGRYLARTLLDNEVGVQLAEAVTQSRDLGKRLRVSLQFAEAAHELAVLPWEYL